MNEGPSWEAERRELTARIAELEAQIETERQSAGTRAVVLVREALAKLEVRAYSTAEAARKAAGVL